MCTGEVMSMLSFDLLEKSESFEIVGSVDWILK